MLPLHKMKKTVVAFILLFFIASKTDAQKRFIPGLKAGLSTSQVDGDTYTGYDKTGFDGGAFVTGKLSDKWSAQFEILFIQKGSKHNPNPDKGDYTFYKMQLNYMEVPVLVQYHLKKFTFELGPGFGYLLTAKEYNGYGELTGTLPFYQTEANFNLGISYTLFKNIGINWRYSSSFLAIRNHESGLGPWYNPGEINKVMAFTVTYRFGSEKTE